MGSIHHIFADKHKRHGKFILTNYNNNSAIATLYEPLFFYGNTTTATHFESLFFLEVILCEINTHPSARPLVNTSDYTITQKNQIKN